MKIITTHLKTDKIVKYIRDGRAPIPKSEVTSHVMSSIRSKNTKPELILRKELWSKNIRGYRLHWKNVPGRPDIAFPAKKIAIFVNGCFWHRCPICKPSKPKSNLVFWRDKFKKNRIRDEKKIKELTKLKWKSIVIWECEIKNNLDKSIRRIQRFTKKY